MKSSEKLVLIDSLLKRINDNILKGKDYYFKFDNKGSNNYCITINKGNKELYVSSYGTFDNVISSAELILELFSVELNRRNNK